MMAYHESFEMSCVHSVVVLVPNRAPLRATVISVVDCRTPRAIVRYRVYWVSLLCPAWPSL
jgi:hypothetical protein